MEVILAGSTGLVGSLLLERLVADSQISQIITVGRRAPDMTAAKVVSRTAAVANWPDLVAKARASVAISTLGTTIRQAGSQAAFAAVDRDALTAFATAAYAAGARQFLMVSSVGANGDASSFYLRTKGEAEDAVRAIGFDRLDIFRPGLLRGARVGPARLGERIGIALSPLTDRITPARLDHIRSIAAGRVADAISHAVGAATPGVFIHHNREMA